MTEPDGLRNCATALARNTITKIDPKRQVSGNDDVSRKGRETIPALGIRMRISTALTTSARSSVRRLSGQRSTSAPAIGPTRRLGIAEATSSALTASADQE